LSLVSKYRFSLLKRNELLAELHLQWITGVVEEDLEFYGVADGFHQNVDEKAQTLNKIYSKNKLT
jgi:hypothetical protein